MFAGINKATFLALSGRGTDSKKTNVTILVEETFHPGIPNPTYGFPAI